MRHKSITIENEKYLIKLYAYEASNNVDEYYMTISLTDATMTFEEQLSTIISAYHSAIDSNNLNDAKPALMRFYLSDAANQRPILEEKIDQDCAISIIQQVPLNGTKVALWVYLMTNTNNERIDEHSYRVSHNGYDEIWSTQYTSDGQDSQEQMENIFHYYVNALSNNECTLKDNCIRTWLYVNDIDNHYAGVVRGRNHVFDEEGLTDDTHYIASTGIGGRDADHRILCKMNAIAIKGIKPEQIHYLYALDHLNRTSEYGVRFERGTYVDFDERRRVYISGTASIDNQGNIMYPGDIRKQTERMWENIEALLKEAECTFEHVAEITVYLRDISDYTVVEKMFREKFPSTPYIILRAPVCRPGWLIESECIAIK